MHFSKATFFSCFNHSFKGPLARCSHFEQTSVVHTCSQLCVPRATWHMPRKALKFQCERCLLSFSWAHAPGWRGWLSTQTCGITHSAVACPNQLGGATFSGSLLGEDELLGAQKRTFRSAASASGQSVILAATPAPPLWWFCTISDIFMQIMIQSEKLLQ